MRWSVSTARQTSSNEFLCVTGDVRPPEELADELGGGTDATVVRIVTGMYPEQDGIAKARWDEKTVGSNA